MGHGLEVHELTGVNVEEDVVDRGERAGGPAEAAAAAEAKRALNVAGVPVVETAMRTSPIFEMLPPPRLEVLYK